MTSAAPTPKVVGQEMKTGTKVLETVIGAVQSFKPVLNIYEHACGLHFYAHDMTRQVEAHHYCSHLNEEVRQCVIYDSDEEDARLIGVEYIISAKLFMALPEDEKKFWHSHIYEVKSGLLTTPTSPVIPRTVADQTENKIMKDLIDTYGKTWHFWQVDRGDKLPYGPAQLMMAPLEDSQVDMGKVLVRDDKYKISTVEKRKIREDIQPKYKKEADADHWAAREDGQVYQTEMILVPQKKKY
ncbi:484_t:CDS:2 [Ambispora gerdemannii]|uniref:484_t:CDS:1 n=1 Tax=Ambispora gerdemannii TaxID=144530 RepID=A0A9N8ZXV6_9GLOM|nr:484_t:CDS:2 [Ambispora gerdemannii]